MPAGTSAGDAGSAGSRSVCTSPQRWAALADSNYSFSVVGTDRVGNVGAPAMAEFMVDTTPPTIGNLAYPPATRDSNFSVTFSVSDRGSGVVKVECRRAPKLL